MRTHLYASVLVALVCVTLTAERAHAFCGFYVSGSSESLVNKATIVVMMREGVRTVLSMQNDYQGPPEGFAMVVPVPVVLQRENVKTLPKAIFDRVTTLSAPRLVEYWERDPCARAIGEEGVMGSRQGKRTHNRYGIPAPTDLGVRIEAQFVVGEYEIVILSARDSAGLDTWLHREHYRIPEGAEPVLRPYVQAGSKFFVARVDPTKVRFENGRAMLSPLRFHYDSEEFVLPVRLGLLNSSGVQDLIVHVLARERYEAASYPNVTIPTNIDVSDDTRTRFGAFYAALFDRTLDRHPGAVVTEYAWDAGSCDPCPTPSLSGEELTTLGADVLPIANGGLVLSRLHYRYEKNSLGHDLVLRAAAPIAGGREWDVTQRSTNHGAHTDAVNNFQARYAIRHAWTGPITCASPRRGIWGAPPDHVHSPATRPALDLANAPRGAVDLARAVRQNVPEIGVVTAAAAAAAAPPSAPSAGARSGCGTCASASTSGRRSSERARTLGATVLAALLVARLRNKRRAVQS